MMNEISASGSATTSSFVSDSDGLMDSAQQPFYVVSIRKLWILFVGTMGLYCLYWFYKHWQEHKIYHQSNSWPIARSIFQIFWTHSLFREIDNTLQSKNIEYKWNMSHSLIATIYVVVTLITNGIDRMSMRTESFTPLDFVTVPLIPILAWCLSQAQKAADRATGDSQGARNDALTAVNYIWLALFGLLWLSLLYGFYLFVSGMQQ